MEGSRADDQPCLTHCLLRHVVGKGQDRKSPKLDLTKCGRKRRVVPRPIHLRAAAAAAYATM